MAAGLQVGTARVDITPPLAVPYLGYEPRQAPFAGVHDPLTARALVADDGSGPVALLCLDAIGLSSRILGPDRHFRDEVCQAVQAAAGIAVERVMLAASHAHSTPETLDLTPLYEVPEAVAWLDDLIGRLAQVTALAASRQRPARLKQGRGELAHMAANRRQLRADGSLWEPARGPSALAVHRPGPLDPEVGVVLVEWYDGTFALLANYTCHPVSVQVQPLVSADYPGAACRLVEHAIPQCRHCLFTQGAAGDVNPRAGGHCPDFGAVARYGQMLGGELLKVAAQVRGDDVPAMPDVADAALVHLVLPPRELPDDAPLRRERVAAEAAVSAATDTAAAAAAAARRRAAAETLRAWDLVQRPMRVPVQVLRLGDVALVGCPGELFVQLGLEIKAQAAAPRALVVGYANDYAGYLSTPTAFLEGGYETRLGPWSQVGAAGGRQVVDAALALVHRLWVGRSA
jgi:hypothetical protein